MTIVPTSEEARVLDIIDGDEPEQIESIGSLEAQTRGEVDIQIATAKKYPRSIKAFLSQTKDLVTVDEQTAESCFYRLPRGGKIIEGPSIRLAEIIASTWGHLRVECRIVDQDSRFIKVRAVAWDLQNNNCWAQEVTRRITDKNGRTFNDDMIGVTSNAAASIALRNMIYRVVPRTYVNALVFLAKQVAVGDIATLGQRRGQALDHFAKLGVPNERVFKTLGVAGIEEITLDHLATLKGLATAIKEGSVQIDEAFADPAAESKPVSGAAAVLDKLNGSKPAETPEPEKPAKGKKSTKEADGEKFVESLEGH